MSPEREVLISHKEKPDGFQVRIGQFVRSQMLSHLQFNGKSHFDRRSTAVPADTNSDLDIRT